MFVCGKPVRDHVIFAARPTCRSGLCVVQWVQWWNSLKLDVTKSLFYHLEHIITLSEVQMIGFRNQHDSVPLQ